MVADFEAQPADVHTTPLLVSSEEIAYWRRCASARGLRHVERAVLDGCVRVAKVALAGALWSWREHWRRVLRSMVNQYVKAEVGRGDIQAGDDRQKEASVVLMCRN
jgi:hypothetical protein